MLWIKNTSSLLVPAVGAAESTGYALWLFTGLSFLFCFLKKISVLSFGLGKGASVRVSLYWRNKRSGEVTLLCGQGKGRKGDAGYTRRQRIFRSGDVIFQIVEVIHIEIISRRKETPSGGIRRIMESYNISGSDLCNAQVIPNGGYPILRVWMLRECKRKNVRASRFLPDSPRPAGHPLTRTDTYQEYLMIAPGGFTVDRYRHAPVRLALHSAQSWHFLSSEFFVFNEEFGFLRAHAFPVWNDAPHDPFRLACVEQNPFWFPPTTAFSRLSLLYGSEDDETHDRIRGPPRRQETSWNGVEGKKKINK